MTIDMQPSMAQSVGTSRSSFSSSNGTEDTPFHNSAAISSADDYESATSNFAPLSPTTLSMAIPDELAGAIPALNRFQGEEICVALQTHINDVMLRCHSKAHSATSNSINGALSNNFKPPNVEVHEKHVQDLAKALEESQRNADQLLQKLQGELKLRSEESHAAEDTMKKLVNEKISLEERISGLEKKKADEIDFLEKKFEQERKALKFQIQGIMKKVAAELSRCRFVNIL